MTIAHTKHELQTVLSGHKSQKVEPEIRQISPFFPQAGLFFLTNKSGNILSLVKKQEETRERRRGNTKRKNSNQRERERFGFRIRSEQTKERILEKMERCPRCKGMVKERIDTWYTWISTSWVDIKSQPENEALKMADEKCEYSGDVEVEHGCSTNVRIRRL